MNRRAKSCGKDGRKAPLEIPSGFPLFAQLQQQQLDDRDHFQQNAKTSVASLRGLIGSSRNIDRHHSGMLIAFIGIPNMHGLWLLVSREGTRILVRYEAWLRPDSYIEGHMEVVGAG